MINIKSKSTHFLFVWWTANGWSVAIIKHNEQVANVTCYHYPFLFAPLPLVGRRIKSSGLCKYCLTLHKIRFKARLLSVANYTWIIVPSCREPTICGGKIILLARGSVLVKNFITSCRLLNISGNTQVAK